MPKRRKLNPAFKCLLKREFPDMQLDEVLKLLDMGLLRVEEGAVSSHVAQAD